ncbi:hypothetical protein CDAR_561831 [Caerostris darwini]|uniref:Uncharacterized protein n=1 Tax=Caerostris darwini TaxID=1538125 RepID=A0AAV4PB86_9ARAC|nr:hypothetical protein CDAR_561831 [Caerostris darwini]
MDVDEEGCVNAAGKSPSKDTCTVPVSPVIVANTMTNTVSNLNMANVLTNMAATMDLTQAPVINNEALYCQQIIQAEKDAAHQKTRYDVELGFVNVANIISDQDLLDKQMAAKLTKETLARAETEYRAALQRVTSQASKITTRIHTKHLDESFANSSSIRWLHLVRGKATKSG